MQTNILISDSGEPLLHDFGRSRIIGLHGFTSRVLGNVGYQAPELIGIMDDVDMDAEMNEEGLADEPFVEQIYSDKLTTKTDIYAYGAVALEVSAEILDYNCTDSMIGLGFENCQGAILMTNPP